VPLVLAEVMTCGCWFSNFPVVAAGMLESRAQEVATALTGVEQRSNERDEQSRCVVASAGWGPAQGAVCVFTHQQGGLT
jgi:hypothetical protein